MQKKSLAKLQIAKTKKKLIKNFDIYQYSSNFWTKEFFKDFLKKREQTAVSKLIDERGIQKSSPKEILNLAQTFYSKNSIKKMKLQSLNKIFSWA